MKASLSPYIVELKYATDLSYFDYVKLLQLTD